MLANTSTVIWLVPLTILVFSVETTFRSLQRMRFHSRGKWTVPICLLVVVAVTIGFWGIAFKMPAIDRCLGSLLWWTANYAEVGAILASGFIFTNIISALIITVQLKRTINMERSERIAGTRVVYSLLISIGIMVRRD